MSCGLDIHFPLFDPPPSDATGSVRSMLERGVLRPPTSNLPEGYIGAYGCPSTVFSFWSSLPEEAKGEWIVISTRRRGVIRREPNTRHTFFRRGSDVGEAIPCFDTKIETTPELLSWFAQSTMTKIYRPGDAAFPCEIATMHVNAGPPIAFVVENIAMVWVVGDQWR
jgi:hypothetical protein